MGVGGLVCRSSGSSTSRAENHPSPEVISVDGNDCGNGMEVKDTLKVPIKPPEAAR